MNFRTVVIGIGLLQALLGCSLPEQAGAPQENAPQDSREVAVSGSDARFIHTVLFWLKEGTTEEQRQSLIEDCKTLLGSIESVRYLAAGIPAGTPREVVDNSFGVGLVVHFEDEAGHQIYQDAEAHLQFIERNQDIWDRVQVYDILKD